MRGYRFVRLANAKNKVDVVYFRNRKMFETIQKPFMIHRRRAPFESLTVNFDVIDFISRIFCGRFLAFCKIGSITLHKRRFRAARTHLLFIHVPIGCEIRIGKTDEHEQKKDLHKLFFTD